MAAYPIPPPDAIKCLSENWKIFEEVYTDYATATELKDTIQVATLKTLMGKECKQVLNCLDLLAGRLKKTATILESLRQHFSPERNVLYKRYLFCSVEQQQNETVDQYVLRLRHLSESCKFTALHDKMIRDWLVLGCGDKAARARLFHEKECTLQRAIEALRTSEATQEQLKCISGPDDEVVNAVSTTSKKQRITDKAHKTIPKEPFQQHRKHIAWQYCGGRHQFDKLKSPAYGKVRHSCGKQNYFQSVCRQTQQQPHNRQLHVVSDCLEEDSDDSAFYTEYVDALHYNKGKKFFVPLHVIEPIGTAIS